MKLEDQVCSLELAKRLKELGVKKEPIFYWRFTTHKDGKRRWKVGIGKNGVPSAFSTFSVAELGEMLPEGFTFPHKVRGRWRESYSTSADWMTEADARAKCLIYLLEKKLSSLEEVNKQILVAATNRTGHQGPSANLKENKMRLNESHIGKTVKTDVWPRLGKVLAIAGDFAWVGPFDCDCPSTTSVDLDWEIVEEPKKPSKRIEEIVGSIHPMTSIASAAYSYIGAIKQFLDEEFEKRK